MNGIRAALIGGVPDVVGGGGLETQITETEAALRALGVDARRQRLDAAWRPNLIHAFSADPATWNHMKNCSIQVPFILSPVLVIESRLQRQLLGPLTSRRVGVSTTLSMRADLIRSADHIVALNEREAHLLTTRFRVSSSRVSVISNGSRAVYSEATIQAATERIACVGTVGDRKQQLELARRWSAQGPLLRIIGPVDPNFQHAPEFLKTVGAHPNVDYLGPLPQSDTWDEQRSALATISFSCDEGQSLAMLDSIALARPVLVRDSDSGRALAQQFASAVRLMPANRPPTPSDLDWVRAASPVPVQPLTWRDVARQLLEVYRMLLT